MSANLLFLAFIFSIFPCVNNKVEYTCKEAVAVTAEFAENESVAIDTPKPVFAADMPESEVISVNGLSRLSINGQLTSPVLFFGNTDFPNPNGVTTSQAGFAADAGIHLHSIIENINYYADLDSISEAEYRQLYSHLHESVKSITEGDPDAKILLRVKVTMPDTGSIPESEIIQYKDKSIKSGVVSMASDLFNEESSRRLAHLVDYVSSNDELSKHIIGYHLENNEWFQYLYRENGQDFSNANNEKFAQWLKVKYPTDRDLQKAWGNSFVKLSTVTIPNNLPGNIYDNSKLYKDILFYGTKTQKYVDYHQYICDLTTARISNLARIIKERTENRAIVISFYGYQFELYSSLSGHHNLNWLLSDKTEYPYDLTIAKRRYRVYGTTLQANDSMGTWLGVLYFTDLTELYQVRDEYIRSRPVVSIILARLLDPSHYGVISIVMIFITLANVFVSNVRDLHLTAIDILRNMQARYMPQRHNAFSFYFFQIRR